MTLMLILMLPGLLLGLWAQMKLKSTYGRFLQEPTDSGISGAEAARMILDNAGLRSMPIEVVPGQLSDHYDPIHKKLALSEANYYGRSISAVGVAAHEAGHALQHKAAYAPMSLRMAVVPVTNIATQLSGVIVMLGLMMQFAGLIWIGVVAFSLFVIFNLITLPVEYDASARAKKELFRLGIVSTNEQRPVAKVLNAAALTYVAALVASLGTLLHYVLLARSADRD